jgi:hypothetical protein
MAAFDANFRTLFKLFKAEEVHEQQIDDSDNMNQRDIPACLDLPLIFLPPTVWYRPPQDAPSNLTYTHYLVYHNLTVSALYPFNDVIIILRGETTAR